MDQDDEKITILLGMGFPDVLAIKKALRLSKGDINEAVTCLTEQPISSYNTVDDLSDMIIPEEGNGSNEYNQTSRNEDSNSLEFPTSSLYELESRVFTESWIIPYKREESLGQCLLAATRLAEEGLCEADKSCQNFLERCLPECFQKLLNSGVVRRWVPDIQEGVFNMVELFIDLVIARLKKGPIPEDLLRNTLSLVFDQDTEWNQKNKHRSSEYIAEVVFAECSSKFETFGWLLDLINVFGNKGGFNLLAQKLNESSDLDSGQMSALLLPVAHCSKYLVDDAISPLFLNPVKRALDYVAKLEESQLKGKRIRFCYQLLESVRQICLHLWPNEAKRITDLHLETIIKMLKTPHFSARMIALKELAILIGNSEKRNSSGTECSYIQDWMTEKKVLSLALEGNLDQVQYTDRMKELVEFIGPKLQEEELTRIWNLCDKASAHVLDNIHRIVVAAASRFNPHQFEHLLKLIRKSWEISNDRLREKLLTLIGRIGQDSRLGRTAEKMLDALWELARVPSLPPPLVHQAIDEHLLILNESASRDQLRKSYIIRCIEDIKRNTHVYLPLKQLHHLSKSIARGSTSYFKTDKATLSELNHSHEIVKLVTESLKKSHLLGVEANKGDPPNSETLIDGKYLHSQYVFAHLDFLRFLLKEGDIYLAWPRCKEIWDTMVANPKASSGDREICFVWFSQCLQDLEPSTQWSLFNERLLNLDPSLLSHSALTCFVEYFYAINLNEHKLVKSGTRVLVDCLDPTGMEFIWHIVLDCSDHQLAEEAIKLLLDMSYLSLTLKLKKDPAHLHQRFISECYKKLEQSLLHVKQSVIGSAVSSATKTLTAMAVSEIASLSPASKRTCLQHIFRILALVERYISTVEEQYTEPRSLLPHAACFLGKPIVVHVNDDSNKHQTVLQCHSNESFGSLRNKIARGMCVPLEQLHQLAVEKDFNEFNNCESSRYHNVINGAECDSRLLHQLNIYSGCKMVAKIVTTTGAQLKEVGDSWNELPDVACYSDSRDDGASASGGGVSNSIMTSSADSSSLTSDSVSPTGATSLADSRLEQEKRLPGVVAANLGKEVFDMLYQLALLDDHKILQAVCDVLYLIPTDPLVADKLDSICAGSMSVASAADGHKTSPVNSPAKREKTSNKTKKKEASSKILKNLLQINPEMTPFRILYNLQVLSSKLMPHGCEGNMQSISQFDEEFLACGGLAILLNLLHKDCLPQEMDYELRQNIYFVTLQLLSYLICGPEWKLEVPISNLQQPPCPAKRSALDASSKSNADRSSLGSASTTFISSKIFQNISLEEWSENVNSIMRVAWASAAGKLYLCSSGLNSFEHPFIGSPETFKTSRENSTGSGHSSGSDSERSFQGGICMQQSSIPYVDTLICIEALPLLVCILGLRPNLLDKWYTMHSVKDFIIELIIGCSSCEVREKACEQFIRLTKITTSISPQPSQFLTQVLMKARLPLWVSSTTARGATLKFVMQCSQYFNLSSKVLSNLTKSAQELLGVDAIQMLEDEINWLINFTTTREVTRERPESGISSLRSAENLLVAGHLSLISALLTCEGVDKEKAGNIVIPLLLSEYLFPASKFMHDSKPVTDLYEASHSCSSKCTGKESRVSAYRLLVQLAMTSEDNFQCLTQQLMTMHHLLDKDALKEFEHSPVVEGRSPSGYVGLKNGGATCYMNSVLQQLYHVPGIQEDILGVNSDEESDDSLYFQLQSLFGHLRESQLQYYTPDKFWKCFCMGDQPVNVREQQDAFEFYSRLSEQVDDFLKSKGIENIFARRFEGVYSIQRICQDCPHRYEREEPFLALNLTVTKCSDLTDSLDQFVKGELLEGDNAYFCEKCSQKRTALIRTCVKSLPSVLVIQLKRFGYDWEASRALKFDDYFKFPWFLDMGPYTAMGLEEQEGFGGTERDVLSSDPPMADSPEPCISYSPHNKKKGSPLHLTMPSTSNFVTPRKTKKIRYELVGVIVHSGQANAGHYYSYIKDRRGNPISNPNKGKWFKFNDTTVEYIEMSESFVEQEWFGGTYKAKVSYDSSNPLPEDRLRYWNGYLLFYDSIDDICCTPKTPKTPRMGRTSRSLRASASSARKNLSLGGFDTKKGSDGFYSSPQKDPIARAAGTSLNELSELLQQGERKGMFRQIMPPRILATIAHENLTFLKNRDLYCEDYYSLIFAICSAVLQENCHSSPSFTPMCINATELGFNFLLNTYLRTKGKEPAIVSKWLDLLTSLLDAEPRASKWAVNYFVSPQGEAHIVPFLLECQDKMVRVHFSSLLVQVLTSECKHSNGTNSVEILVRNFLLLLSSEVPVAVKNSQQYFTLLHSYCSHGMAQCKQILDLGGCSFLIGFLLNTESSKRRWSSVQSQDFGPLHSTLATLILACDISFITSKFNNDQNQNSSNAKDAKGGLLPTPTPSINEDLYTDVPAVIQEILFGYLRDQWLKEVTLAYREIVGGIPKLTSALKAVSANNSNFSFALLTLIMNQYAFAPSNMLKDLSHLLLELLSTSDSLHTERISAVLGGFIGTNDQQISGLLSLIDTNKEGDSRRAYQCIKLIVSLSARSPDAREQLTNTQSCWQWAVEWLEEKMEDHSANNSVGTATDLACFSNEDSNTKNFQRTTSAQWTLEEATALLSGMDAVGMDVDCEQELADIKETSESESSPSIKGTVEKDLKLSDDAGS